MVSNIPTVDFVSIKNLPKFFHLYFGSSYITKSSKNVAINSAPDYGAHFYVGLIVEEGNKYFVSYETFKNLDTSTFKFKIPIDICDQNSLLVCLIKLKELI